MFALTQTHIEAELSRLLPFGETTIEQLLVDQVRQGPTSRLVLLGIQNGSLEVLTQASRELATRMENTQDFLQVNNGGQQRLPDQESLLFQYRLLLSPSVSPSSFTPSALHEELNDRLNDLASPIAPLVKKTLRHDPIGALAKLLSAWVPASRPKTSRGVWVSADGRMAILAAQTHAPGLDLDAQEKIQERLQENFQQVVNSNNGFQALQLLMAGPAVFAVQARADMKREAQWLSLGAILCVTVFIYSLYRSWRVLFLCFLPLLSGVLAGVTGVTLLDGYIHGVTLAFGVTLIGVAVDYPLHLFTHVTASIPVKTAIRGIWPIMRLGVITTGIGYSALFFSGFPGLTQLGVFAIVGLSTAALVTRWVLPGFLPSHYQANPKLDRMIPIILRAPKVKWFLPVVGLISVVFLLGSDQQIWEDDLTNLSPLPREKQVLDQTIRQGLGAPGVRDMLILEAETEDLVLQKSERVIPALNQFVEKGMLKGYDLAARYLPSPKTQLARQAALPELPQVNTAIQEAMTDLPFQSGLFDPFLQDLEKSKKLLPLTLERIQKTPLGIKLQSLLFHRGQNWVALIPLQQVLERDQLKSAVLGLKESGIHYLDIKEESNRIITTYQQEMLKLLAIGGFLIALSLGIGLRSFRQCFRIFIPVLGSVMIVAAFLHIGGQRLSLFHLASFLLVVGIGLDYGLFSNRRHSSTEERARTLQAVVICSLTTVLAFSLLAFSQFPVLLAIGTTAATGSLLSLLFSATFAIGKVESSSLPSEG